MSSANSGLQVIRARLRKRKEEFELREIEVNLDMKAIRELVKPIVKQKKLETNSDFTSQWQVHQPETQLPMRSTWEYSKQRETFRARQMYLPMYYPPYCSGYDISFCRSEESIYVFGGISCSSQLNEGIKTHFYKFFNDRWVQVKSQSIYNPMPRFGHTLTTNQRDLILFGGVSEYKEKLKDRCFYSDLSAFNTAKNTWRIIETAGQNLKARRNHAACVWMRFFIVSGGIDDAEEVLNDLSWINLDCKKPRWKSHRIEGRFNHKIVHMETENGRDYLCLFGGRNEASQIINLLQLFPIQLVDGDIAVREPIVISHSISPRQMPMVNILGRGILIFGGVSQDNEVVEDSWYFNIQSQQLSPAALNIQANELRGAKAASIDCAKIYMLANNSVKYKALEISLE